MEWGKTDKVEDLFQVGDEVEVKLIEIDPKTNKLRLSRRALLEKPEGYVEPVRRPVLQALAIKAVAEGAKADSVKISTKTENSKNGLGRF